MLLSQVFGIQTIGSALMVDFKALAVLAIVVAISFFYTKWKKKTCSPILLIVISGLLGILFY